MKITKKKKSIIFIFFTFIIIGVFICWDRKNYNVDPPSDFTGEWLVYSKNYGKPILKVTYTNGKKNGREISWHADSELIDCEQKYLDGKLHGTSKRYDNIPSSPLLTEGVFKEGEPWEGTFFFHEKVYVKNRFSGF